MPVRAGVVGSPVDHSLSPLLHTAAYDALGLTGWSYHRAEVARGELTAYVAGLPEDWRGLSVTMPGKEEALALAATAGPEAGQVGAANTLVRTERGWHAENTDVVGLQRALREAGVERPERVDLVGSGATARAALLALQRVGAARVRLVVRDTARAATRDLAQRLGLGVETVRYEDWPASGDADLVLSTVPPGATPAVDPVPVVGGGVVLDVVYAPWPTPLAAAVRRRGGRAVGGGTMLLHQAAAQVELMTGRAAPVAAMRAALAARLPEVAR
jgi:shikimate dehydrogenase